MTKTSRKCGLCGRRFKVNGRGRPRRYCCRSHRERAYEKRKFAEIERPSDRTYRLLNRDLEALHTQRLKWNRIIRWLPRGEQLDPETAGPPAYGRAIARVRKALNELAPEIVRPRPESRGGEKLQKSEKVFIRLVKKHHPDKGGDTQVMQDINELWQAVQDDLAKPR